MEQVSATPFAELSYPDWLEKRRFEWALFHTHLMALLLLSPFNRRHIVLLFSVVTKKCTVAGRYNKAEQSEYSSRITQLGTFIARSCAHFPCGTFHICRSERRAFACGSYHAHMGATCLLWRHNLKICLWRDTLLFNDIFHTDKVFQESLQTLWIF